SSAPHGTATYATARVTDATRPTALAGNSVWRAVKNDTRTSAAEPPRIVQPTIIAHNAGQTTGTHRPMHAVEMANCSDRPVPYRSMHRGASDAPTTAPRPCPANTTPSAS